MGLDMYLEGKIMYANTGQTVDNYPLREQTVELGYWRKHPNLHGYIVDTFAEDDDCQPITLFEEEIEKILNAIGNDQLPETSGFFFGKSYVPGDSEYTEQKNNDLQKFTDALEWLKKKSDDYHKNVVYQASW